MPVLTLDPPTCGDPGGPDPLQARHRGHEHSKSPSCPRVVESDGQRVLHLVHEERSGSLVTLDPADLLSRLGRHPAFGVGAQHPDLGTTHRLAGHRLLCHPDRVARPAGTFDDSLLADDDPVVGERLAVGKARLRLGARGGPFRVTPAGRGRGR